LNCGTPLKASISHRTGIDASEALHADSLLADSGLTTILSGLRLTAEQVLEKNETFLILKCKDQRSRAFVIKYSHSPELRQGRARIHNEAALVKNLKSQKPLRFLKYYAHGQNFLVTEFEEGEVLSPNADYDDGLRRSVAEALIQFQLLDIVPAAIGVERRAGLKAFYLKGIIKHVLHLWPNDISLFDSLRCLWIVVSTLPLLGKTRVICHGDLLPTNLIYKAAEKEIVFTDLEGFLSENHPLYDVLSFCTVDDGSIWQWHWQKRFIQYYLEKTKGIFRFDTRAGDFRKILRALLAFLLLYRLNESRVNLEGSSYFDGLSKWKYVLKKIGRVLTGKVSRAGAGIQHVNLAARKDNLKAVLSKKLFARHVTWLFDVHQA
jgi:hypothetical protein